MSKTVKQIYSVALSATTIAMMSGAALTIPAVSLAQTTSCTFTRSLTVGSRGADVSCLQDALIADDYLQIAASTGYFGKLTKAAVRKWQAAAGVSPTSGFFGPISRAAYAEAMEGAVASTPSTPGTPKPTTPGTPKPTTPGTPTVPAPASGLAVSVTAQQPSGSAIAGAGQIDVAKFTFAASNQAGVTVTDLELMRTGVVSDSNISNLYLADEQGVIFAQYSSLNIGKAVFNGLNMMVNAGQSRVVTLRMDLSSSATAGNTLGWSLNKVTVTGGGAVTGLPVSGPTLTVTSVSNPSIAAVTYTYVTTGSTVDAGTNSFLAHSATVNVTNSAALLKSIKYTVVGSANKADLKNALLKISGVTVATSPTISGDTVIFVPTAEVRLPTGNSTLEIFVDVTGSPNRTMAWNVLRPYDGVFTDTQYSANLTPSTSGTATTVTINQGRVTISKSTDTPTANIPLGASNVTLAKFSFYAGGEPVKVRFLPVRITRSGNVTTAVNIDVRNVSVIDDVGNSVGTSISSPTGNWGTVDSTVSSYAADFGTSSSYINYIVPANTTRILSVKADVQSGATATTLLAVLRTPSSANLEGQISFQSSTGGTASGNTLTIATTPLTVSLNGSFASPTYVAGANNTRVASFILTASSAEGERVSTITFDKDVNADFDAQSLKVMVGGTQFGTTQAIVADTETAMTFSGASPILVPAGGSVVVDLYADILTSTTQATHSLVFDLTSGSAVGATSNSAVTWPAAVSGQSIVISAGPTVTLTTDSDNVSARYLVMGSADNVLYRLKLAANNTEDVRVTDITFRDSVAPTTTVASYNNVRLYDGDILLAGPVNITLGTAANPTLNTAVFSLGSSSSLIVPKNGSKTITVKADVPTFISGGALSNSAHTMSISATSSVTAYGKDSSSAATISGTPTGTAQTIFRTKPTLTSSVLGATSARTRVAVDDIATLNWTAHVADDLTITSVVVKFIGSAVNSGTAAFTADLIDATTNAAWGTATQQTCTPGPGNSCIVTFSPSFSITRGTTKAVKMRANSSSFANAANTGDGVSVIADAAASILWSDGTSTLTNWEAVQIPITLINVSYE